MDIKKFLCVLLLLGITITGLFASPVPTNSDAPTTTANDTLDVGNDDDKLEKTDSDDATLECIMEVITVMASESDEAMSPTCKTMLGSLQENNIKVDQPATKLPTTEKSKVDLQTQLLDLTSQLRDAQSANVRSESADENEEDLMDVKRNMPVPDGDHEGDHDHSNPDGENPLVEKKAKISLESDTSKETENESREDMEEPFMTSLNSDNDEFLIIPLKYLQKQMLSTSKQTEVQGPTNDQEEAFEPEENPTENIDEGREINNAIGNAIDNEKAEEDETHIDEDRLDALFRVEMDISRLSEDLNRLKTRKQKETSQ